MMAYQGFVLISKPAWMPHVLKGPSWLVYDLDFSVSQSITLIQTKISQQLLDKLTWTDIQVPLKMNSYYKTIDIPISISLTLCYILCDTPFCQHSGISM